jgi:hypothetical protein
MNLSEQLAIQAMYDEKAKAEKPVATGSPDEVIIDTPKRRGRPRKASL